MGTTTTRQPFRAAAAAFFGTAIEWYDFHCYATAAALVFGDVFFATHDRFMGTLASLGTFAVGFLARPIGALLFGYVGDKVGRKQSLIITLLMMGLASTLIGFLPSYQSIGAAAALLLVLLRVIQGVAVGGEWGGAVLIAAEHAPPRWRTFLAAAPQYGSPVGLMLATTSFQIVSAMPDADFKSWGWRIPFLVSALLLAVDFLIRRGVNESPELEAHRTQRTKAGHAGEASPLKTILASFKGRLAIGIGLSMLGISGFYFVTTLMITFTTGFLQIARHDILRIINYTGVVQLVAFPIGSYLAHRIGERRFLVMVTGATLVWAAPMMMLVMTRDLQNIAIALLVAIALMSGYYSVVASFLPKAFPVEVRYTGISLSYQLCSAIFGGTTPLVGLWIAQTYGGAQWGPLASMFAIIVACTLVAALLLPGREEIAVRDARVGISGQS